MKLQVIIALSMGILTAGYADAQSDARLFNVASRSVQNADFTSAAESTINGVVAIKNYATVSYNSGFPGFDDPFFEYFFGDGSGSGQMRRPRRGEDKEQERGFGSGVIVTKDGYIITNNHVVDGAERLEVVLNDNRTFNATLIGTDPMTDLALVKIDADDLPVIPMGNSDDLKIGEWVLAVGNPFGLT